MEKQFDAILERAAEGSYARATETSLGGTCKKANGPITASVVPYEVAYDDNGNAIEFPVDYDIPEETIEMTQEIQMIAAIDQKGALGKDGDLIIRNKEDMDFFKARTEGCTLIMGRKTWESIGPKPLPGRTCIVLTSEPQRVRGRSNGPAFFVKGKCAALEIAEKCNRRVVVIGGASIYEMFEPEANLIWITAWDTVIPDADTFITPKIYEGRVGETIGHLNHRDGYTGLIRAYKRKTEANWSK